MNRAVARPKTKRIMRSILILKYGLGEVDNYIPQTSILE
jgi:hypothetical protein